MNQLRLNLKQCRKCPRCQAQPANGGCRGPCACLAHPQREDIHKLAQAHADGDDEACVLKRFKRRWLAGDIIATAIRRTGLKWLHWKWRQLRNPNAPEDCRRCLKTREAINQVDEKVRNAVRARL